MTKVKVERRLGIADGAALKIDFIGTIGERQNKLRRLI